MLKLRNIKKNNGIISAEYDPEDSGKIGSVSIDIESEKTIESNASELDDTFPIYLNHAINALLEMKDDEEIPEERLVMWY